MQVEEPAPGAGDRVFLMFHGYGNSEKEMVSILDAVAEPLPADAKPSYFSFQAPFRRPYIGGYSWYSKKSDGLTRRAACDEVGNALVSLLESPLFAGRRLTLMGFSQGAFLSYRLVQQWPDLFDTAVLLSPSFKEDEDDSSAIAGLGSTTKFILAYGTADTQIPAEDQARCRRVLSATGRCTELTYEGMGHAVCKDEIEDLRRLLF
ncbi:phospholipase [Bifidobacterium sp. BRDM6]|uniref:Phospholipase n=2 Tax=Bifidobacterium choloepi TaxID=2614131 RepID=A0A6I5N9H7_9BIFI|nr:phospholipase [Bifidobacterium choloepi]